MSNAACGKRFDLRFILASSLKRSTETRVRGMKFCMLNVFIEELENGATKAHGINYNTFALRIAKKLKRLLKRR